MSNEKESNDLTPEQRYVTQDHGTEPAYSGKYNDTKTEGSYNCICCGVNSSVLPANLIRELDGQVFGNQPQTKVWKHRKI